MISHVVIFLTSVFPCPGFITLLELLYDVLDHERVCLSWLLVLTLKFRFWSMERWALMEISCLVEIEWELVASNLKLVWDLDSLGWVSLGLHLVTLTRLESWPIWYLVVDLVTSKFLFRSIHLGRGKLELRILLDFCLGTYSLISCSFFWNCSLEMLGEC